MADFTFPVKPFLPRSSELEWDWSPLLSRGSHRTSQPGQVSGLASSHWRQGWDRFWTNSGLWPREWLHAEQCRVRVPGVKGPVIFCSPWWGKCSFYKYLDIPKSHVCLYERFENHSTIRTEMGLFMLDYQFIHRNPTEGKNMCPYYMNIWTFFKTVMWKC